MSGGQRARCSISRILTNHRTVDMPRQRTGKRFGLGSAREPWGAAVREQILGESYRACGCKGNLFGSCPSRHTAKLQGESIPRLFEFTRRSQWPTIHIGRDGATGAGRARQSN